MLARAVGGISPTILIGASAALALLAVALQGSVVGLLLPLVVASVFCFLLAFVAGAIARRAARPQNWRGRYVGDQPPSFDDWMRRIRGKDPRDEP